MAKITVKNRFGITPNCLLNNKLIGLRAKALFAFIQSKPDEWDFSIEKISYQCKEGSGAIAPALKELEDFGYLQRLKKHDAKGHWLIEYVLHDSPQEVITVSGISRGRLNPLTANDHNNSKKEILVKKKESKEGFFLNEEEEEKATLISNYDFTKCNLKEGHPHRQLIESGLRLFSFFKQKTQNKDLEIYSLREWLEPIKFLLKNYNREQIEELVEYANTDKFWGAIVLNTESLQKNFEKIKAQLTKSLNEK